MLQPAYRPAFQPVYASVSRHRKRALCSTDSSHSNPGNHRDESRVNRREPARVALLLQYRGTHFHGWAAQKDSTVRTVQGEVERALVDAGAPTAIALAGASRTDAGAHARAQVAHFDAPPLFADAR